MSHEHEDVLRVVDWIARLTEEDRSELLARVQQRAPREEGRQVAPIVTDGHVPRVSSLPRAQVALPTMASSASA
ncbi:hypothetical protein [Kineococcus sp. SYSU DK005]|uniref:hypothetical protein n=1 Tax=Kineococcus sp. SYSU DK005 TaxID=3383126 RepID=UPI003D7D445F